MVRRGRKCNLVCTCIDYIVQIQCAFYNIQTKMPEPLSSFRLGLGPGTTGAREGLGLKYEIIKSFDRNKATFQCSIVSDN